MVTHFNRDKLARNLPDVYRQDDSSNNAKILEIEKSASDSLRKAVGEIYESLDIDKAYGATLDLYGDMLGHPRGTATDEQFRVLIKNKITRNFANADYNSIVLAICSTCDCEPSEIILKESEEPCTVTLEGLPISKLNESNIDINTAVQIINALLPAGVHMEAMRFAGTFEFCGAELVYDEAAGFADEAQTIGGYLGLVSDNAGGSLPV